MNTSNSSYSFGTTRNNTSDFHPKEISHLFVIVICILGICGNGIVFIVYFKSKHRLNSCEKRSLRTVLHLAFTDLLTMTCIALTCIVLMIERNMPSYVCLSFSSIPMYLTFVTQCVLAVTTIDRYVAVCQQEKYSELMTDRTTNGLFAISWILPLSFSIAPIFGVEDFSDMQKCYPRDMLDESTYIAQTAFFMTVMIITLALYIPILLKARKFHLKTRPAQFIGINAHTMRLKAKKRALRKSYFFGALTIFFLVCNVPFTVTKFLYGMDYSKDRVASQVSFILGLLNSVANPFIYAGQNMSIRREAIKMIRCKCLTKDTNQSDFRLSQPQQEEIPLATLPRYTRCGNLIPRDQEDTPVVESKYLVKYKTASEDNEAHNMERTTSSNAGVYQDPSIVETHI